MKKTTHKTARGGCCLEPLFYLDDRGEKAVVTADLPCVRKEDVDVRVSENGVEISARMAKAYRFERWGTVQRGITYRSFKKTIILPYAVEAEKATSRFVQGILEVTLPKKQAKKKLTVD